jgi:V/A-type H+-transporting ATPase subunit I
MMRPRPARWFDALVARDDTTLLLEALAATGTVELEAREASALPEELRQAQPGLGEFATLEARYGTYWPRDRSRPSRFPESPAATLARGLSALREWATTAEPQIGALQALDERRAATAAWLAALTALHDAGSWLAPGGLATCGPGLAAALFEAPAEQAAGFAAGALELALPAAEGERRGLLLADAASAARTQAAVLAAHGRWWPAPAWLRGDLSASLAAGHAELSRIDAEATTRRAALDAAAATHGLVGVLSDLARLRWLLGAVRGLGSEGLFARITGWTSDRDGARLSAAVEASGARALLHFPAPRRELAPPLLLANPAWARPFELFARAFGMPSRDAADPTPVLAVVVPLMFGYMFGDVGQGAVLLAVGAWLRRRHPLGRLLMWGGAMSIVFGFAFGSVFAREDVIPALWLHPLSQPLTMLVVPLVAGALLLAVGLGLAALGAWWRHALGDWLLREAGAAVCWLALLAALLDPRALWIAAAGAVWMALGHALHARRAMALLSGLGECLERTLQLCVNTLSFARVGAFALAHAGLGSAVSALADATSHPLAAALAMLLGNLLILLLEGLVVSIQATRLVLFEFFARFFTATGRMFVPLPPPPSQPQEAS